MKSATAEPRAIGAGAISWQLAQTFWVGGLWLFQFVLMPALAKLGLAPLLLSEVQQALGPLLVGFAVVCAVLQAVVLIQVERWVSLWRDMRGQLLVTVLLMALAYFFVQQWQPEAVRWLMFSYMVMAVCGLILVLQPVPGRAR